MWYKIYEESVKARAETSFPHQNYTKLEIIMIIKKNQLNMFDPWKWMNKQRLDGNVSALLILRVIPACICIMHTYWNTVEVYGSDTVKTIFCP